MTYEGFLRIGGVDVVNTERIRGYLATLDCPRGLIKTDPCVGLADAVGDEDYTYEDISLAPWYDVSLPELSSRFYGVVGLDLIGMTDSTRTANLTEGIDPGGVIGGKRKGMRSVVVQAMMFAKGRDALDYGDSWLNSVFDGTCSTHGTACGTTDAEFFTECPPDLSDTQTPEEYAATVNPLRRFMHNVAVTSGPTQVRLVRIPDTDIYGKIVEWTLTSERPWLYGLPKTVTLNPTLPTVAEDTPFNRVTHPSAELGSGNVTISTNLSANPSVETNTTGWLQSGGTVSGPAPTAFISSGRSTELAAVGAASYRVRLLGDNGATAVTGAVSDIAAYQEVSIPAGTDRRISLNMWAACLVTAGSAPNTVLQGLTVRYLFLNGGAPVGGTTIFGTAAASEFGGNAYSLTGLAVPATATAVRISAAARVTWSSLATAGQNSDIRLFADALQVSIP